MHIALLSTPFIRIPPAGYGGTELFCYELAEALHDRGHEVTVFTTGDSVTRCRKRSLYWRAEWPMTSADDVNHVAWAYEQIAKSRQAFDVVHNNSPLGVPFSRFVHTPVVHTLHHSRVEPCSRIYATHPEVHYVAISHRQLQLEAPLPHASVIHHGVSPSRYPPSPADAGYLLHLGRYCPEKGTHVAIDVAELADLPIRLAGRVHEAGERYFDERVRPRLRDDVVIDVGEADQEAKIALLRGARALVLPLQWEEPFGLVAIEAMFSGTPVLGYARGSLPELVDEGVTGYLVAPGDVVAMAARARSLATFDRRRCAERARARFSAATMVDAYEALYESIAVARRGAQAA
jgi:glycosyltransferase involved in cell wall biosynthesis